MTQEELEGFKSRLGRFPELKAIESGYWMEIKGKLGPRGGWKRLCYSTTKEGSPFAERFVGEIGRAHV